MKNKKRIVGGVIVVCIVVMGIFIFHKSPVRTESLCYQGHCFTLEIADTIASQESGLMYRTSLAPNHGMIFVFPHADIYDFRMKNTLIPLDMLRLDSLYKVVDIQEAVPCTQGPCRIYRPAGEAMYVIELAGGIAKKFSISSRASFVAE